MKNWLKVTLLLAIAFVVLTLLRLAYVVSNNSDIKANTAYGYGGQDSFFNSNADVTDKDVTNSYLYKNIARVRVDKAGLQQGQMPGAIEQAYEKTGNMQSTSYDFEKDEKSLRESIGTFKAITQREQLSGLKGARSIMMAIGVPPESFDVFVEQLKKIGTLSSFEVQKADMTGSYKQLQSKKAALVESRNSLLELKKRNGKIEELMNLETKIYDIGKEIQSLSAGINVFEAGKDYCTVNFTLLESGKKITVFARLLDAMEWAFYKTFLIVFKVSEAWSFVRFYDMMV